MLFNKMKHLAQYGLRRNSEPIKSTFTAKFVHGYYFVRVGFRHGRKDDRSNLFECHKSELDGWDARDYFCILPRDITIKKVRNALIRIYEDWATNPDDLNQQKKIRFNHIQDLRFISIPEQDETFTKIQRYSINMKCRDHDRDTKGDSWCWVTVFR